MIDYDFENEAARECAAWIMEQLGPEALTVDAFLEFTNGSGFAPYDWEIDRWVDEYFEWACSPAWQRLVWEAWDAYTDARLSDYRRDWDFYAAF